MMGWNKRAERGETKAMFWEEEYHAREAWRQNQENELGAKIERLRAERDEAQRWYKEAISLREQNKQLLAALCDMIEISKRNSDASLMLLAIRKCAAHAIAKDMTYSVSGDPFNPQIEVAKAADSTNTIRHLEAEIERLRAEKQTLKRWLTKLMRGRDAITKWRSPEIKLD